MFKARGYGDLGKRDRSPGRKNAITKERPLPRVNQRTLMLIAGQTGQLPSFSLRMLGCPHPDCMLGQDQGMSPSLHTRVSMGQEELQFSSLTSSEPGLPSPGKGMVQVAQRCSILPPRSRLRAVISEEGLTAWGHGSRTTAKSLAEVQCCLC